MAMLSRSMVLVIVSVLAVAACAAPPRENPPTSPPGSSSMSTTPSPGEVTVTGTVRSGVESGCLLLPTSAVEYLLLGGDQSTLRPGQSVRVRGMPRPGTPTTCQQGVPLEVREVQPA